MHNVPSIAQLVKNVESQKKKMEEWKEEAKPKVQNSSFEKQSRMFNCSRCSFQHPFEWAMNGHVYVEHGIVTDIYDFQRTTNIL